MHSQSNAEGFEKHGDHEIERGIHVNTDTSSIPQVFDESSYPSFADNYHTPLVMSVARDPQPALSPATTTASKVTTLQVAECCPGLPNTSEIVSESTYTPQHMILMHYTSIVPNFTKANQNIVDIAVRHAVVAPYFLDEVLAFTAFHMTHLYPGSAKPLLCLATELQNRALAIFTQTSKTVTSDDKATAVPRFLFSAVLGRHVLADTLVHSRADLHLFVDRFLECININRGVMTVTPSAREHLCDTEAEPFIRSVREAEGKVTSTGNECDLLRRVMNESDLNEGSIEACRQAIDTLQWSFDLCRGLDEDDYPQAASVFSVRIGVGYDDVLRKYRPEALLVLAYYGVLLHRCRNFWAFRDAGAPLIHAIADHLGSYWQDALAWPLCALEMVDSPVPSELHSNVLN